MPMSKRKIIAVSAVALLIAGHIFNELRFVDDELRVSGVVESVEPVESERLGIKQRAVVRLANGSTVSANVLPACVVFPGQVAQLVGGRTSYLSRTYMVMAANDAP